MSGKNNKFHFKSFFAGLGIGIALIIGAFFTYLLVVDKKENFFTRHVVTAFSKKEKALPVLTPKQFIKPIEKEKLIPDSAFYWNTWDELVSKPGYREMDSLFIDSVVKKIFADSVYNAKSKEETDIIIKNDKLILSKSVVVIDQQLNANNDSINSFNYSEKKFMVEFWTSPINFRGYKRKDNLIILYGKSPEQIESYVQIDKNLYIKDKNNWYLILNNQDFSDFIPVKDEETLKRLNLALVKKQIDNGSL